jgi:hypothetical protein
MFANKHNFAPRVGIAKNLSRSGLLIRAAYGIFFTPVDLNTWCNQRHNVPYVFPETQQADNFTPPAALFNTGMNFGMPVLGVGALPATTVSFTVFSAPRLHSTFSNGTPRWGRVSGSIPRWKRATSALADIICSARS